MRKLVYLVLVFSGLVAFFSGCDDEPKDKHKPEDKPNPARFVLVSLDFRC